MICRSPSAPQNMKNIFFTYSFFSSIFLDFFSDSLSNLARSAALMSCVQRCEDEPHTSQGLPSEQFSTILSSFPCPRHEDSHPGQRIGNFLLMYFFSRSIYLLKYNTTLLSICLVYGPEEIRSRIFACWRIPRARAVALASFLKGVVLLFTAIISI